MYPMENHIQRAELCKREISKCHPFEGEMLDEIRSFYRISTTWASNALEGNTPVRISGAEIILPPASKIPAEMNKFDKWMRENEHTMHPVAYAAELYRRFVEIHPFKERKNCTAFDECGIYSEWISSMRNIAAA